MPVIRKRQFAAIYQQKSKSPEMRNPLNAILTADFSHSLVRHCIGGRSAGRAKQKGKVSSGLSPNEAGMICPALGKRGLPSNHPFKNRVGTGKTTSHA
jgi:hypothetical protein